MNLRGIVFGLMLTSGAAQAGTVFFDDFNSNAIGLNSVPTGWTVTDGYVDVVGFPAYGELCAGGNESLNKCVDLDGTGDRAGVLSKTFALTAGLTYTASFDLAGNQRAYEGFRGAPDDVVVRFGASSLSLLNITNDAPWTRYSLSFTPDSSGTYSLSFANAGGDLVGAVLDNVAIVAVPEPSTYALLMAGLVGVVVARRKREKAD